MGKRYTRTVSKQRSKWYAFSKNKREYDIKEACVHQALFPRYRPGYCSPVPSYPYFLESTRRLRMTAELIKVDCLSCASTE
jgi:hypothetical protein